MERFKKIIVISVLFILSVYILLYSLYMGGAFIKEEFSGIEVKNLLIGYPIVGENIFIDDLDDSSEIVLSLSEVQSKNIEFICEFKCGWEYEYKYYEIQKDLPEVKYKEIEYSIERNNILYAESKKNDTIFTEYGTCDDWCKETGTISIATNGQITRDYNSASAGAELKRLLLESENSEKKGFFALVLDRIRVPKKEDGKEGENEWNF